MENNNVNVNESVKMVGGFDNLDSYVDWLNSDESDDLANAYAEANMNVDDLVLIEEETVNQMHNIIKMQDRMIKEKDKMLKETYIRVEGVIDEMNDILDDAII